MNLVTDLYDSATRLDLIYYRALYVASKTAEERQAIVGAVDARLKSLYERSPVDQVSFKTWWLHDCPGGLEAHVLRDEFTGWRR